MFIYETIHNFLDPETSRTFIDPKTLYRYQIQKLWAISFWNIQPIFAHSTINMLDLYEKIGLVDAAETNS